MWDYSANLKGDGIEIAATNINGYLVDAPSVSIAKRMKPLSTILPSIDSGVKTIDNGNLLVDSTDFLAVTLDPVAARYLRRFVGAKELIQGIDRWCFWLPGLDPGDLSRSSLLRERVEACRDWRAAQTTTGDAWKHRDTPHLFRSNRHRDVPHLIIPSVSSETRKFIPAGHFDGDVIASNLNFVAEDPDGFAFAIVSSSAFITWQKAIGGRLKSDMRFSNTLVWNTFPVPAVDGSIREAIIAGGQAVLDARKQLEDRAASSGRKKPSLADLYNPLAMDPILSKAHAVLDKAVDAALGLKGPQTNETRLTRLFELYQELTSA
jgi:hypothetical protein